MLILKSKYCTVFKVLSLCGHRLSCIRTWDAFVQCHVAWVKEWALLGKLGSHRSTRKGGRISQISQCPHRETCWDQGTVLAAHCGFVFPPPKLLSLLMVWYKSNLSSEGDRQTPGMLRCLQELSRKGSCPEPVGLDGPRVVGGPSFRRMKSLVPREAVWVEPFPLGEAGRPWSQGTPCPGNPEWAPRVFFQMILTIITHDLLWRTPNSTLW